MTAVSNNKKIAQNTLYLYIRTIIVMIAMLYTSRIVLQALGAKDLGVYNVVGGIVALMSFFQATLTKATSRFLTYELGANSSESKLKKIFSLSMTIHIVIVLLIILIGESVGLYILYNWTEIPSSRFLAALCVYQCSLLIFCIHLLRVPYNAVIIAHENMSVYAYMSIFEASLQLILAFILLKFHGDKLMLYGFLMLFVAMIVFIGYYSYVRCCFKLYRYTFMWDRCYSLKILSFSGWTLCGSSTNVATQQGVSLLFNNYIGLLANTALGFANQVNGAVSTFVTNFTTAFNPQIIKLCAQQDLSRLHILMNRASKFSFVLMWVMTLPLIANMNFVLQLWLDEVPLYTSEFCQMILLCSVVDSVTGVYNTAITATGRIKIYQICLSLSFLLDLCCAFLLLSFHYSPILVFGSRIITRGFINMFIGWYFTSRMIKFKILEHCKVVLFPILLTIIITVPIMILVNSYFTGWSALVISCFSSFLLMFMCTLIIIMDSNERSSIYLLIKNKNAKRRV